MQPFSAEYWHIGAITIRFARSSGPTRIGLKSADLPTMKLPRGYTAGTCACTRRAFCYFQREPRSRGLALYLGQLISRGDAGGERLQAIFIDALE